MIWFLLGYSPEQVMEAALVGIALLAIVIGFLHVNLHSLREQCKVEGHIWDWKDTDNDLPQKLYCVRCGDTPNDTI